MDSIDISFICGMSRGGTTWLGNILNEHSDVAVFGESLYWGRQFVIPKNGSTYSIAESKIVLDNLSKSSYAFFGDGPGNLKTVNQELWKCDLPKLCPDEPVTPGELFRRVCTWLADKEGVSHIVEKTPHHVDWIPRITSEIPSAKFIINIRDAYGFMLSYKHQGDRKGERVKRVLKKLYHPAGCAYVWRRYIRSTQRALRFCPDQVRVVHFKSLKEAPEECWSEVQAFLGIESEPLVLVSDRNSSFPGDKKPLEPIDIFWMNLIAGKEMDEFGYPRRSSGVSLKAIIISCIQLIGWGFSAFGIVRKQIHGSLFRYIRGSA